MKNTLFIFLSFLLLTSCSEESSDTPLEGELEDNFTISGTISEGDNLNFYLEAISQLSLPLI